MSASGAAAAEPAVSVESVSVVYGAGAASVHALRELSLEVSRAEFVVVRGRSGSGKTTLLQVVAGLRRPSAGRVRVGGTALHALSEAESARFRRRQIGLVYQFFNLVPTLSVQHNVALPLLLDGKSIGAVRDRVEALLARLGIAGLGARATNELSGGQMQRVAIARALAAEPVLVLADEPTGNLDTETGRSVLALFRELCDERGTAFLMMTHDSEAAAFADRVVVLRDGAIGEEGGTRAAAASA